MATPTSKQDANRGPGETPQIGIDAVVDWIMKQIGALVSGPAATALAAAIVITLTMAAFAVAVAKLYSQAITQPVKRGVLICAKFTYTLCIDGLCHKYLVHKEINLRISPRAAGHYDVGTGDLWTGAGGELGDVLPEDLIQWQYLQDLIARIAAQIATETDPLNRIDLQAQKQEAERQLAEMTRAQKFIRDLRQQLGQSVCDALKDGDSRDSLAKHNLAPCAQIY